MGLWTPAATTTPVLPQFCTRERTVARLADGLAFSSFSGPSGDAEHYITVEAPGELSLPRQLDVIAQRYAEATQALRLPPESAIFRRLYLSDAANQAALVRDSSLFQEPLDSPVAVSMVQQPPLPGGKVAMLAYHLDSGTKLTKRSVPPGHVIVEKGNLGHLWSTRLCATNTAQQSSPADQTREVFGRLIDVLADNGAALAENCVRTWIYVKDVDVFYQGHGRRRPQRAVRTARPEPGYPLHRQHRHRGRLRAPLRRGADGCLFHPRACCPAGLLPERLRPPVRDQGLQRHVRARHPHRLCRPRASLHLRHRQHRSSRQVVHPGDVLRQLERALENVDALLRSGDAGLDDMIASHRLSARPERPSALSRPISPNASRICRG